MANTKIVLNRQSDLILNNASIIAPVGIEKSDIPSLVSDLSALETANSVEESRALSAELLLQNNLFELTIRTHKLKIQIKLK